MQNFGIGAPCQRHRDHGVEIELQALVIACLFWNRDMEACGKKTIDLVLRAGHEDVVPDMIGHVRYSLNDKAGMKRRRPTGGAAHEQAGDRRR
jgi:hypothetical protein